MGHTLCHFIVLSLAVLDPLMSSCSSSLGSQGICLRLWSGLPPCRNVVEGESFTQLSCDISHFQVRKAPHLFSPFLVSTQQSKDRLFQNNFRNMKIKSLQRVDILSPQLLLTWLLRV